MLLNNNTDIIVAFGAVNHQLITGLQVHKKPTILFGTVNKELSSLDLKKQTSGVDNFTYLIESESFVEDLRLFKELTGYKNLGVAIDAPLADILPYTEALDQEMSALGVSYRLIPFNSVSDITANLQGVDALYMVGGFFMSKNQVSALAKILIEKKIPSFTVNGPADVSAGLMATNQSGENLEQFHWRLALTIEAYINKQALSQLPVYIDFAPRLTVNFNTADALGIPLKFSLIGETDFVGDPKNSVSDKVYSLLGAIKAGLDNNLSLRASEKDVELSIQDLKSAKSNYLPSVTAVATGT